MPGPVGPDSAWLAGLSATGQRHLAADAQAYAGALDDVVLVAPPAGPVEAAAQLDACARLCEAGATDPNDRLAQSLAAARHRLAPVPGAPPRRALLAAALAATD